MSTADYPHIEVGEDAVPRIAGTTTKVVEVVLDKLAYDWDPVEIHRQHPYLSLAQIHAAFTYYYDHRDELDRDIERRLSHVDEVRARWAATLPSLQRLAHAGSH